MSEKTVTERDAVMRERATGARMRCLYAHEMHKDERPCRDCEGRARQLYPLPKVTRPRVVADPHGKGYWRTGSWFDARGAALFHAEQSDSGCALGEWVLAGNYGLHITDERVKLWADLLANPTEMVDDDA